jgi:molybdopterin molybdotransferase/putative molybdopterin biosynthesis protein
MTVHNRNDAGHPRILTDIEAALDRLASQDQFLEVVDRDEAIARFHHHLRLRPLGSEEVPLAYSLNRVLAASVVAEVDVPGFDRASVDGFAVRSGDTARASERDPIVLTLNPEILTPGVEPRLPVLDGSASLIATGGMVPRGADAIVMVEHTETLAAHGKTSIQIHRAATPGQFIAFAGSDLARGEMVVRAGETITSREIGMLAAVGRSCVLVHSKPRVAIVSTGDEILAPGQPLRAGQVYDSNAAILAAAVVEAGGVPEQLGIGPDDEDQLARLIAIGLDCCDAVVMSGGTSKGAGDVCYRAVARLTDPGVVVHGVALKPGKPLCLAVSVGKPVAVLPGFPTSAIFTFHEFVAPVIRSLAGLPQHETERMPATLPLRVTSERGRTEYMMVSLVRNADDSGLVAYPLGKGSGSVTTFSQADGFIAIDPQVESVAADTAVSVTLIGRTHGLAELVIIGSHCIGLDLIVEHLQARGLAVKTMNVGSTGGLSAALRGECDIAPIHLMDPISGEYNRPLLTPDLELVAGYRRLQGVVFRKGDRRFEGRSGEVAVEAALGAADCLMVSRNAGSGTRILIDRLLRGNRPPGYWLQPKSHNAVAAAVAQMRADWGVSIESVARRYDLGFIPLQDEHYDFVVPKVRLQRPAVQRFRAALEDEGLRDTLTAAGFGL